MPPPSSCPPATRGHPPRRPHPQLRPRITLVPGLPAAAADPALAAAQAVDAARLDGQREEDEGEVLATLSFTDLAGLATKPRVLRRWSVAAPRASVAACLTWAETQDAAEQPGQTLATCSNAAGRPAAIFLRQPGAGWAVLPVTPPAVPPVIQPAVPPVIQPAALPR